VTLGALTSTQLGHRPGSPEFRRLEFAMLTAGLAAFSLLYFTQALLPPISREYGVGATTASLTVSAATGALALAMVPLASVAESFGRIRAMRTGLGSACLLAFGCAFAPNFLVLLLLRGLVGVALAAVVAVAVGHLGDEVHPTAAGTAIGLYVAGNSLGGVLGRLVPGLVSDHGSVRSAILVLAACSTLAVLAFFVLTPPAVNFTPTPAHLSAHIEVVRGLVRDAGLRRLCVVGFLLMGGFVACYNYLGFRLTEAPITLSPGLASLVFLAYLAGTVSSPVAGRLADHYGRRSVLSASIILALTGLALTIPNSLLCVASGLIIFTTGFFGAHSVASGWVSAGATHNRAQASALYLMAYYLGSSAVGAGAGLAYQQWGWLALVAVIAALFGLALIAAVGVKR
jgi:YNFM family putative membrane transporter